MQPSILLAYLVTFTASFFIMVIELVAGRILAPYIGQHLYSWTSIIGVCLAGISIGAWLGGWLADRFPRRGTLGWILFFAGLLTLAIPIATDTIGTHVPFEHSVTLMTRIVLYTAMIFLPSAIVLGMVSPTVIRLVIKDLEHTGSVVGGIYAFSTLGSIVGTFATGFYLIEEYGTRPLVYAVGAVLVVISPLVGGLFGRATRALTLLLAVGVIGLLGFYAYRPDIAARHHWAIKKYVSPPLSISPYDTADLGVSTAAADGGGARVVSVSRDGAAAEAGLEAGDVIVEMDSRKIADADELDRTLYYRNINQSVALKYKRGNQVREATATLKPYRKWFYRSTGEPDYVYYNETNYFTIKVKDIDHRDRQTHESRVLRELVLDNLIHSHSDGDDPSYLAYEYLRIYEELVGWKVKEMGTSKHRQLFVGGGGYTLQRYFHHLYKDCHIDVAEIDPGVTYVAEKYMFAPKNDPRLVTYNTDGRLFVKDKQNTKDKYEFIFGDAFNDLSIPFHLTTQEFDTQLKNLLTKNGLLMSLVIDHVGQGRFLPSFLATMRAAFGDDNVVLVMIDKGSSRDKIIAYLKEQKLDGLIKELETKKLDDVIPELEAKNLSEVISYLAARKADDFAPYLKPTELDYYSHDTVIVVASPTKQNWDEFGQYLDGLNKQYADEGFGKSTVSHVFRPSEITEYLNTRVRRANWVDRLRGRGNENVPWTPVVLTDDYAPVDNLTAPMFEQRYGYKKKKAAQ